MRLTPAQLLTLYVAGGALFLITATWLFAEIAEDVINHDAFLGGIDHNVARWLHAHATPAMTTAMILVSYLGAPLASIVVGLATAMVLWRQQRHDALLAVLIAVPCGMLLNVLMKYVVQRQRPAFADPIVTLTSYSFPSGHALGATLLYGVLAAIVVWTTKDPRWRALAVASALVVIALVSFSRIYLGVHYLSDVVAGFLAGVVWLTLALFATGMFRRRRKRRNDG